MAEIPEYILKQKSEVEAVKGIRLDAVVIDEAHTTYGAQWRSGVIRDMQAQGIPASTVAKAMRVFGVSTAEAASSFDAAQHAMHQLTRQLMADEDRLLLEGKA